MSKFTLRLITVALAAELFAVGVDAYVSRTPASLNPALADFAAAQKGQMVDVRLDLGEERDGPRLGLNGLTLEFLGDDVGAGRAPPLLSGATGGPLARKTSSSPLYGLRKIRDPSHISMTGVKTVEMTDGCWRLFYESGAPSGSVVCGFHFPEEITYRNGASLSPCDVYLTFNVWGGKDLSTLREKKAHNRRSAAQHRQESEALVERGRSAAGVLAWAANYRRALRAAEKSWRASRARKRSFDYIPEEGEALRLGDEMYLSKKGTVWTGAMRGGKFRYRTLGTAVVATSDAH